MANFILYRSKASLLPLFDFVLRPARGSWNWVSQGFVSVINPMALVDSISGGAASVNDGKSSWWASS